MGARIPESWHKRRLGEMCDICRGSSPRPIADQRYFQGGTIPWIKIADATKSGKYLYETKEHVNEFGASFSRLLPKGSLIIAASGTLGYPQMLGVDGCAHDGWLIPSNFRGIDKHFLYYLFLWKKEFFYSSAYGAAIQNINTMILRDMEVVIPPLATQRQIAAVLSAYDDLIESNTRRIIILEAMAQAIYREWFVEFRFPGHGKVKMVDSPLGKVPVTWEVRPIGEIIETTGGGTPSTKNPEYWDEGNITWYSPTDLTKSGTMFIRNSATRITDKGLRGSSARMFPAYSVMMTSRATIGVIAINTTPACTNQGFITCIPNERLSAAQLYYWLTGKREEILAVASGATFKEINKGTFRKMLITLSDADTSQRFNATVEPFIRCVENLEAKQRLLRTTRDFLVPKLISGAIDVEGMDIAVDESNGDAEPQATKQKPRK